mmetsp:Transcript_38248/g.57256  ORF Transcript_38248/g.57256 Transcript_38248/m.57256 type:complete len:197 (-) Transcript_38248:946-1536(-)
MSNYDFKRQSLCPDCGYKHQEGIVAGFFAPLDSIRGKYNDNDENQKNEPGDSLKDKLNTPKFVRDIGYVRCNCTTGVPSNKPGRWVPVPNPRYVGSIKLNPKDLEECTWDSHATPPSVDILSLVFYYLDGRTLGRSCCVATTWRDMCFCMPHYVDLLHIRMVATFDAHNDAVKAIISYQDSLISTGEDFSNDYPFW